MNRKEKFRKLTDIIDPKGNLKYLPLNGKIPSIKFIDAENKNDIQDYYDLDVQSFKNIGLLLPDYLCVIDIDYHKNSAIGYENMDKLVEKFGTLPNTLIVKTPGKGLHLYFKVDPLRMANFSKGKLAEEIDFQYGNNVMVVCVSSWSSKHGKSYEFAEDLKIYSNEIAELPGNWYNAIPSKEKKTKSKNKIIKKQSIKPNTNYKEQPKDIKEIIQYAFQSAIENKGEFVDGNRFYGLQSYAGSCNLYGVPEQYSIQFAEANIGGDYISIISGIYEKYNEQFGIKSFSERKKKANPFDYSKLVSTEKIRPKAEKYLKLKNNWIYRPSEPFVQKIMIISPPNTGKTYYTMNSLPEEDFKKKYIYAFPTKSLGLQKAEETGIYFVKEGSYPKFGLNKIATTFDSLEKFFGSDEFRPQDYILVIDEVHNIISTNNYRSKIMKKMKEYFSDFYRVIALTATPIESLLFDEFQVFCFESEKDTDKYDIIFCKDKSKTLDKYLVKGKTNFIFLNGKEKAEEEASSLEQQGYRTLLLNKETVKHPSAESILTTSKFDQHYDAVFLTSFWAEGVDIYGCNVGNFIFYYFNGIIPPVTVKQVLYRVRDIKPINTYLFLTDKNKKVYDQSIIYDPLRIKNENLNFATQMINSWNNLSKTEEYKYDINKFLMNYIGNTKKLIEYDFFDYSLTIDNYQIEASVYNRRQQIMDQNPQEYINGLAEFGLIFNNFHIEQNELSKEEKKQKASERELKRKAKEELQISIIRKLINDRSNMQIEDFKRGIEDDSETKDLKRKIIIIFDKINVYNLHSRIIAKYTNIGRFVSKLMEECLNNEKKFKMILQKLKVLNFKYNEEVMDDSEFLKGMFAAFKPDEEYTTVEIEEKIIALAKIDNRIQIFDVSYGFQDIKNKKLEILRYFFDDSKTTKRDKENKKDHISCYKLSPVL